MLKNLENISPLPEEIKRFLSELSMNKRVDRLIVFGSRAFGDYEKYSDLDLAVDAPRFTKFEWFKLKEFVIYDLRTFLHVSMVHFSSNPPKLKERITQTGKIIYDKQSKTKR